MVDFYGKLGLARWKLKGNDFLSSNYPPPETVVLPVSLSGTSVAWGLGVQAHVKMFGVRLEYEGFDVNNNRATVGSLSVFVNF